MRTLRGTAVLTLQAMALGAGARVAGAQTANLRVAGRVQTQYTAVSGDSTAFFNANGVVRTAFEVRRLRIQAEARIGENITLIVQPSFEMAALRMRDAYLRVGLVRTEALGVGLTMGQEKKPFNRYELTSSNNLLSIERGARLRGFSGPLSVQNNLLEANGYIAHDIGASLDLTGWSNRLLFKLGMYNGSGESAADVNNAKTWAARATATVLVDEERRPVLRVGAALISRDRAVTTTATSAAFFPDSSHRTAAFGLEAEWGDFRPGLHVIADFATGDALRSGNQCRTATFTPISCQFDTGRNFGNLRPGVDSSGTLFAPRFVTFRSLHLIVARRWQPEDRTGSHLIKSIEPALRLDLTDPDTDGGKDGGLLVTPVLNLYFAQTALARVGLDFYRYHDPAGASRSVRALRVSWQASF